MPESSCQNVEFGSDVTAKKTFTYEQIFILQMFRPPIHFKRSFTNMLGVQKFVDKLYSKLLSSGKELQKMLEHFCEDMIAFSKKSISDVRYYC